MLMLCIRIMRITVQTALRADCGFDADLPLAVRTPLMPLPHLPRLLGHHQRRRRLRPRPGVGRRPTQGVSIDPRGLGRAFFISQPSLFGRCETKGVSIDPRGLGRAFFIWQPSLFGRGETKGVTIDLRGRA